MGPMTRTEPKPNPRRRYDFPRAKPGAETHVFRCRTEGMRLDQYLVTRFSGYSRNFLAGLIREGRVYVGGAAAKPSRRLLADDEITVVLPEARRSAPEEMDIPIVFEDEHLFVVNKPPGIVVHPARGHLSGTLYHGLLWRFREQLAADPEFRIGPVHRLDQDTSGLLVYGKAEKTQQRLALALEKRNVKKRYLAIVHGELEFAGTIVDGALGPDERGEGRVAIDGQESRPARTGFRRLAAAGGWSLVECDLLTGRCHQIRVHLQALGHPIAGDLLYGGRRQTDSGEPIIDRQALHAWRLALEHPVSREPVEFVAPLPADMAELAGRLGLEVPA